MIKNFSIGNVVSYHGAAWIVTDKRLDKYTLVSLSGDNLRRQVSDQDPAHFLADTALDYAKQSLDNNF
ncbi:MAG: hypothetical protein GY757_53625 [bacterium]|nr:hypothetical protein [bacterium]